MEKISTDKIKKDLVDYIQAKKDFMDMVEHWLNSQSPYNKRIYELHSQKYIAMNIRNILTTKKSNPKYAVIQKGGKDILILKKKSKYDPNIQVLSWEEIFDLFMPMHVQSGHKGREVLINMTEAEYKFPSMCLTFFKRICNVCNEREVALRTSPLSSQTVLVYVISMVRMRNNEQLRYLLIYADEDTNYVLLRPLMTKTELEISMELFKIFTTFGPPRILHMHGYNENLTKLVDINLKQICPKFKIQVEHNPVSYDMPTTVTDRIQEWMRSNNSDIWEVGTSIVQKQMNDDPKMKPKSCKLYGQFVTPRSLFFRIPSSTVTQTEQSTKTMKTLSDPASPSPETKPEPMLTEEGSDIEDTRTVEDSLDIELVGPNDSDVIDLDDDNDS